MPVDLRMNPATMNAFGLNPDNTPNQVRTVNYDDSIMPEESDLAALNAMFNHD
jgi:hypothetical protein